MTGPIPTAQSIKINAIEYFLGCSFPFSHQSKLSTCNVKPCEMRAFRSSLRLQSVRKSPISQDLGLHSQAVKGSICKAGWSKGPCDRRSRLSSRVHGESGRRLCTSTMPSWAKPMKLQSPECLPTLYTKGKVWA